MLPRVRSAVYTATILSLLQASASYGDQTQNPFRSRELLCVTGFAMLVGGNASMSLWNVRRFKANQKIAEAKADAKNAGELAEKLKSASAEVATQKELLESLRSSNPATSLKILEEQQNRMTELVGKLKDLSMEAMQVAEIRFENLDEMMANLKNDKKILSTLEANHAEEEVLRHQENRVLAKTSNIDRVIVSAVTRGDLAEREVSALSTLLTTIRQGNLEKVQLERSALNGGFKIGLAYAVIGVGLEMLDVEIPTLLNVQSLPDDGSIRSSVGEALGQILDGIPKPSCGSLW